MRAGWVAGEDAGAVLLVGGRLFDLALGTPPLELELACAAADCPEFPIPKEELGFVNGFADMAFTCACTCTDSMTLRAITTKEETY